jgi:hypothetical protein
MVSPSKTSNVTFIEKPHCAGRTFLLDYSHRGQSPEVKRQVVDMAMNASGICDTARVLHVIPNTVMAELKKGSDLEPVNHAMLHVPHPEHIEVAICCSEELDRRRGLTSELDEIWSCVRSKAHQRWSWHAINHHSGHILAYVFGRRQDTVIRLSCPW